MKFFVFIKRKRLLSEEAVENERKKSKVQGIISTLPLRTLEFSYSLCFFLYRDRIDGEFFRSGIVAQVSN